MPPWTEIAAIATGVAALATAGLAFATFRMGGKTADAALATQEDAAASKDAATVAKRALELSIRPLLAEPRQVGLREAGSKPPPAIFEIDPTGATRELLVAVPSGYDAVQFGAPARLLIPIPNGAFWWGRKDALFLLSVPFENVGAGVAMIQDATVVPCGVVEIRTSAKVVPVGTSVRVSVSIPLGPPQVSQFEGDTWAADGVHVSIEYSDSDGGQTLISQMEIRQYATQAPFVETIAFFRKGESEPFVRGRSPDAMWVHGET
jgi:hypothetical protein